MNAKDVIRAWKDEAFRNSLSREQRAMLPQNPAGAVELDAEDLDAVAAGGPCACTNPGGGGHVCACLMDY